MHKLYQFSKKPFLPLQALSCLREHKCKENAQKALFALEALHEGVDHIQSNGSFLLQQNVEQSEEGMTIYTYYQLHLLGMSEQKQTFSVPSTAHVFLLECGIFSIDEGKVVKIISLK